MNQTLHKSSFTWSSPVNFNVYSRYYIQYAECCSGITNLLFTYILPTGIDWYCWWHLAPLGHRSILQVCTSWEQHEHRKWFSESDKPISAGNATWLRQETDLNSQQSKYPQVSGNKWILSLFYLWTALLIMEAIKVGDICVLDLYMQCNSGLEMNLHPPSFKWTQNVKPHLSYS